MRGFFHESGQAEPEQHCDVRGGSIQPDLFFFGGAGDLRGDNMVYLFTNHRDTLQRFIVFSDFFIIRDLPCDSGKIGNARFVESDQRMA